MRSIKASAETLQTSPWEWKATASSNKLGGCVKKEVGAQRGANGKLRNWQEFTLMTQITPITLPFQTLALKHTPGSSLSHLQNKERLRMWRCVYMTLSSCLHAGLCRRAWSEVYGAGSHKQQPAPILPSQHTSRDKKSIGLAVANGCLHKGTSQAESSINRSLEVSVLGVGWGLGLNVGGRVEVSCSFPLI